MSPDSEEGDLSRIAASAQPTAVGISRVIACREVTNYRMNPLLSASPLDYAIALLHGGRRAYPPEALSPSGGPGWRKVGMVAGKYRAGMGTAQDFGWRSAAMRMTRVAAAAASVSVLLDVVWPPAANTATAVAWLGSFWTLNETLDPATRFWAKLVPLAGLVAAASVIWGVVYLVWPHGLQPIWLHHLSNICVAWVSCLTVIGVIELRVRRQRAKVIAGDGLL